MRRSFVILAIAMFIPLSASASSSITVSRMDCSGDLTISVLDRASLACSGSFALSGGNIFSGSEVEIAANGSLELGDLSIAAPFVRLAGDTLSIGQGVMINVSGFANGTIEFRPFDLGSGGSTQLSYPVQYPAGRIEARPGSISGAAGTITLVSPGGISLGSGSVTLPSGSNIIPAGGVISLGSGSIMTLQQGGNGLPVSAVPEPESYRSMLFGMLVVLGVASRRNRRPESP